jgi:6-phosphogluconate dehydrogenase
MQVGMIGLGRTGASMVRRLMRGGHTCVVHNRSRPGRVSDSGEGRWTLAASIDESVPAPVLAAALFQRFSSRGEAGFADRILSAMRGQFGGHIEKP